MTTSYMLDLETYGQSTEACIKSIGVVEFDPVHGTMGRSRHLRILLHGGPTEGVCDSSTVEFWLQQPKERQQELLTNGDGYSLEQALHTFSDWICDDGNPAREMWSNAPTFDEIILRAAYERIGQRLPIHYRNSRCYRTIKAICLASGFDPGRIEHSGSHDALQDAREQAANLIKFYKHLNLSK